MYMGDLFSPFLWQAYFGIGIMKIHKIQEPITTYQKIVVEKYTLLVQ